MFINDYLNLTHCLLKIISYRFDSLIYIGVTNECIVIINALIIDLHILYFFDYKTEFVFLPKQSQRSYKMDLDLQDCLGRYNSYHSKIA